MAQLSSVVSSILRDCIMAQHKANRLSQELRQDYASNGTMEGFRLPGVEIDELEIDLKYAVKEAGVVRQISRIDRQRMNEFFDTCSEETATLAVDTAAALLGTLARHGMDEEEHVIRQLQGARLGKNLKEFLARKLSAAMNADRSKLINPAGDADAGQLTETLMAVLSGDLAHNPELTAFAASSTGLKPEAWVGGIEQRLKNAVELLVAKLVKDCRFLRPRSFLSLDIDVSAAELEKLPDEAVHAVRLRIAPRHYELFDNPGKDQNP